MIRHTLETPLRDILENGMGKNRGRPRLGYFSKIMKDLVGLLEKSKSWQEILSRKEVFVSNQS